MLAGFFYGIAFVLWALWLFFTLTLDKDDFLLAETHPLWILGVNILGVILSAWGTCLVMW